MTFDRNITARYAARVAELVSLGDQLGRALSHAPFRHLHPRSRLRDYAPSSPFSAWDAVPPSPYVHAPLQSDGCLSSTTSIHYCAFYPVFDPRLLLGCLANFVSSAATVSSTPRLPVHEAEYNLRHHHVAHSQLKLL